MELKQFNPAKLGGHTCTDLQITSTAFTQLPNNEFSFIIRGEGFNITFNNDECHRFFQNRIEEMQESDEDDDDDELCRECFSDLAEKDGLCSECWMKSY